AAGRRPPPHARPAASAGHRVADACAAVGGELTFLTGRCCGGRADRAALGELAAAPLRPVHRRGPADQLARTGRALARERPPRPPLPAPPTVSAGPEARAV